MTETERQLALYRKAINRIDDMVEYARPHLTRAQIHQILADLTAALADDDDPRYILTPLGAAMLEGKKK